MKHQAAHHPTEKPPLSLQVVNRVLVVVIVILALLSGYFHARWQTEQNRSSRLKRINQQLVQEATDSGTVSP